MFINQFAHYNLYMTDMCRSGINRYGYDGAVEKYRQRATVTVCAMNL